MTPVTPTPRDPLSADRGVMRALVACEYSGRVRSALRARGVDAWSCDLLPAEDGSEFHFQGDVTDYLGGGIVFSSHRNPFHWDLLIGHPPCTYLANSGAKHLYVGMKREGGICPDRWAKMEAAARFYAALWNAPIRRVAIENPVMHGHASALIQRLAPGHPVRRQFVQPWWFGHHEVKATGLALRGLPPLTKTNDVYAETMALPYAERAKVHYASPGPDRWKDRSRTLQGVADAMAAAWSSPAAAQHRLFGEAA